MNIIKHFYKSDSSLNSRLYISILLFFMLFSKRMYGYEFNCRSIYNNTDVTLALQQAINSGASKIFIPYMGIDTKWISGPLTITDKRNIDIILEPGVILESKSGSFTDRLVSFITLNNCSNIKIVGFDAEIRMLKHEYTDIGEWRHAISVLSSDSIEVQGLKVAMAGGDGIYIGSNKGVVNYCSNVILRNIIAERNARNGISVISCRNLLIEDCEIFNTGIDNNKNNATGGPWAGIDLEPNFQNEILENVIINNCVLANNRGAGFAFAFGGYLNTVTVTNNEIHDNWSGINLLGKLRGESGHLSFKNNNITGKQHYGMYFLNWNRTQMRVDIEDCAFDLERILMPVKFEISDEGKAGLVYGNVFFHDIQFQNVKNSCLVYLEGADSTDWFTDISLSGPTVIYENEFIQYYNNDLLRSSSYLDDSIYGDPFFCCIEEDQMQITVEPNPVFDQFRLACNTNNLIDLRIYDASGRLVMKEYSSNGSIIRCSGLPGGHYFVIAKDMVNQRVAREKLIKN